MKLDTIKLLREAFNCNDEVAKKLAEIMNPQLIAEMIQEKLGKEVKVKPETAVKPAAVVEIKPEAAPAATPAPAARISNTAKVRAAIAAYDKNVVVSVQDIHTVTGVDKKNCYAILWSLWKKDEIKSEETGVYITK